MGSDFYWDIFSGTIKRGQDGPIALESKLGRVLSGCFEAGKAGNKNIFSPKCIQTQHVLKVATETNLIDTVNKFWDLETLGIKVDEKSNLNEFIDEIKLNGEGRYEMKLPFKPNHSFLSDNFQNCKSRLERKLIELKKKSGNVKKV